MRQLVPVFLLAAALAWAGGEEEEEGPTPVSDEEAKAALERFEEAFKDDAVDARAKACLALGKAYHATVQKRLLGILSKDKESKVRAGAAVALGQHGDTAVVPSLIKAMDECRDLPEAMAGICVALGELGDKRAVKPLTDDLWKTKTGYVVEARIAALGKIRDVSAIEELLDLFYVAGGEAVKVYFPAIGKSLSKLTGQNYGGDRDGWKEWWRKNKASFEFPEEDEDDPQRPKRPRRQR